MQEGTILDQVGRTPLIPLRRLTTELRAAVFVKVESLNPGGSIKPFCDPATVTSTPHSSWR